MFRISLILALFATAFAMANAALAAIRKGVDFYKEAQAAAKDVSEVATDITGHIGKFLDAKSVIQEAAEEVNKEPENDEDVKPESIDSQALNSVMMQIQLENAETELREMLIYQTPGLDNVWERFSTERERLRQLQKKHQERADEIQRKKKMEIARMRKERRERLHHIWEELTYMLVIATSAIFLAIMLHLVVENRKEHYPEFGTCFIPKGSFGHDWWSSLRWNDCEE